MKRSRLLDLHENKNLGLRNYIRSETIYKILDRFDIVFFDSTLGNFRVKGRFHLMDW